jgi:hypothetical protein
MEPISEALKLLKRQAEIQQGLRRNSTTRVIEERELYLIRNRLAQFPAAVQAIALTAAELHRPIENLSRDTDVPAGPQRSRSEASRDLRRVREEFPQKSDADISGKCERMSAHFCGYSSLSPRDRFRDSAITLANCPRTRPPMPDTLHLAAWNINHRTGRKSIPPDTLHAIAALDIDVLVLTEFVDGPHHEPLQGEPQGHRLREPRGVRKGPAPEPGPDRRPHPARRRRPAPPSRSHRGRHHQLAAPPSARVQARDRRLPRTVYLNNDDRLGYWQQVEGDRPVRPRASRRVPRRLQLDPHTDTRPCAQVFPRLTSEGFTLANPRATGATTPATAWRHPHRPRARQSHGYALTEARYLYKTGRHTARRPANGHGPALSDHALLSIRVERPVVVQRTGPPDTAAA